MTKEDERGIIPFTNQHPDWLQQAGFVPGLIRKVGRLVLTDSQGDISGSESVPEDKVVHWLDACAYNGKSESYYTAIIHELRTQRILEGYVVSREGFPPHVEIPLCDSHIEYSPANTELLLHYLQAGGRFEAQVVLGSVMAHRNLQVLLSHLKGKADATGPFKPFSHTSLPVGEVVNGIYFNNSYGCGGKDFDPSYRIIVEENASFYQWLGQNRRFLDGNRPGTQSPQYTCRFVSQVNAALAKVLKVEPVNFNQWKSRAELELLDGDRSLLESSTAPISP